MGFNEIDNEGIIAEFVHGIRCKPYEIHSNNFNKYEITICDG